MLLVQTIIYHSGCLACKVVVSPMSGSTAARLAAAMAAAELGLGPERADELLAFGELMGLDFDAFGTDRSKSDLISHHNSALRDLVRHFDGRGMHVMTTSNSWDTKPKEDFPRPPPFGALLPINCTDLQLHTTHRGRVLRGKLVVDAMFMQGVHSVLQDEHGDVVQVKFYNTPELAHRTSGSFMAAFRLAQQLFPKGQAVAIIEPYYKLASDGMRGVRVDNPAEVVFLDDLEETAEALQQKGDKCLAQHEYKEAVSCYNKALRKQQDDTQSADSSQAQSGQLLQSVLLNLSAAHSQLKHPKQALLFAAAAAALSSHSNSKAYYRAAVAVDQLLTDTKTYRDSSNFSTSSSCRDSLCCKREVATAARELMEVAVRLSGLTSASAKSQMMAALVNAARTPGSSSRAQSSKQDAARSKSAAKSEVWGTVCHLLATNMSELAECFALSDDSNKTSSREVGIQCASKNGITEASSQKDTGNAAFKEGSYATALHHYQEALAALQTSATAPLSIILSSRAVAWLKQPSNHSQQQAFLDAVASILLAPQQPAGFMTAASAVLQLENIAGAEAVCQIGLLLHPESTELQQLLRSVQAAVHAAETAESRQQKGTPLGSSMTAASDTDTPEGSSSSRGQSSVSGKCSQRGNKHNGQKQRGQQARQNNSSSTGSSSSSNTGDRLMSEREYKQFIDSENCSVEQVAMFNEMISSAMRMNARAGRSAEGIDKMLLPNDRVPKLHEEFLRTGRCPPQVNQDWAGRMLWEAYELARAMPMQLMGLLKRETVTPQVLLPRLGELTRERVQWMLEAEVGSVSFQKTYHPYNGGWQSFINCPARSEVLTPGTTHVAIGFVDLSGLAASCTFLTNKNTTRAAANRANAAGASSRGSGRSKPFRWVGYEMSIPCIAKTLVLLQMMQQGATMVQVLQVWYSSAWSNSTLAAFGSAITELLTTAVTISQAPPKQQQFLHPSAEALTATEVLTLLRHWQIKQVPLAAAREGWQHSRHRSLSWITNFKRRQDRVALCELALTGELCALGPGDTGSVAMFAVPAASCSGERAMDESFLQSLPFHTLVEAWTTAGARDIVSVAVDLLKQRTRELIDMIRDGAVKPEVHLGAVSLDSPHVVASIKAMKPYTISWSNVPDYMSPASFHKLARAISAPSDTVHFMHSMNWVRSVKGAVHLDLTICMPEENLAEVIPELKQAGDKATTMMYRVLGLQHLLLCPSIDNPRNVVDFGLYIHRYQAYVDAFFAPSLSGMRRPARQVQVVEPPFYSILSRTNSTMHITFSYDEDIYFQSISQP